VTSDQQQTATRLNISLVCCRPRAILRGATALRLPAPRSGRSAVEVSNQLARQIPSDRNGVFIQPHHSLTFARHAVRPDQSALRGMPMYSVAAAAAATGLNQTTVLRAIQTGHISGTNTEHGESTVSTRRC
jgi:hypothetical protein